jgi:hypothetical protein
MLRIAPLLVLAIALSVGCGGGPSAAVSPSPSASAPTSASPSPSVNACASPTVTAAAVTPKLVRAAMAYDVGRRQVILFGAPNGNPIPETWEWMAATGWKQLNPSHSPPARTSASMADDEATQSIVLFGGQLIGTAASALTDTWTWDGSDWTQQNPAQTPPAVVITSLAYDPLTHSVLATFDDTSAKTETWQWNGTTWSQLQPATAPQYAKQGAGMAFSGAAQVMVLFGTVYGLGLPAADGATWTYSVGTWTSHAARTTDPRPRMNPGIAAGPNGSVVLFGGGGSGFTAYAETWAWSGTWQKKAASQPPSKRTSPLMAYDQSCQLVLMYGGELQASANSNAQYTDTWVWNGQAWTKVG